MADAPCTSESLPCSDTVTGNLFLVVVYSLILAGGAKLITTGSEKLMSILDPGIIGGFVLPVLGALPDAAIIFVSALGGDKEQVQEQLAVGMGTLAGSNVLLLTVPWAAAVWLGRNDISSTSKTAKGAFIVAKIRGSNLQEAETWWALAALLVCCVEFIGYSIYQVLDVTMQQRRLEKAKKRIMWRRFVDRLAKQVKSQRKTQRLSGSGGSFRKSMDGGSGLSRKLSGISNSFLRRSYGSSEQSSPVPTSSQRLSVQQPDPPREYSLGINPAGSATTLLRQAFMKNAPDKFILRQCFNAWRESIGKTNYSDDEEGEEEDSGSTKMTSSRSSSRRTTPSSSLKRSGDSFLSQSPRPRFIIKRTPQENAPSVAEKREPNYDEEAAEPLIDKSPAASLVVRIPKQSKTRVAIKSIAFLVGGTGIVLLFADPIVKSIAALGNSINLSPFYIAFIVTPIASNAAELVSSYVFASKKTKKTISLIHSALYGAVSMNNTISLGVFLAMILFRQLVWYFSAETLVIFIIVVMLGILGSFKSTIRLYHIIWVFALYPLSLLLVALLESDLVGWE